MQYISATEPPVSQFSFSCNIFCIMCWFSQFNIHCQFRETVCRYYSREAGFDTVHDAFTPLKNGNSNGIQLLAAAALVVPCEAVATAVDMVIAQATSAFVVESVMLWIWLQQLYCYNAILLQQRIVKPHSFEDMTVLPVHPRNSAIQKLHYNTRQAAQRPEENIAIVSFCKTGICYICTLHTYVSCQHF